MRENNVQPSFSQLNQNYQRASSQLNALMNDSTQFDILGVKLHLNDVFQCVQHIAKSSTSNSDATNHSPANSSFSKISSPITRDFVSYLAQIRINDTETVAYDPAQFSANQSTKVDKSDQLVEAFDYLADNIKGNKSLVNLLEWKSDLAYSLGLFLSSQTSEP